MTAKEKKELLPYALWFNFFIGFYNLYLYTNSEWWFNLIVGSLNIGVWVFNRKSAFSLWKTKVVDD
jgi:hypothetical protein